MTWRWRGRQMFCGCAKENWSECWLGGTCLLSAINHINDRNFDSQPAASAVAHTPCNLCITLTDTNDSPTGNTGDVSWLDLTAHVLIAFFWLSCPDSQMMILGIPATYRAYEYHENSPGLQELRSSYNPMDLQERISWWQYVDLKFQHWAYF